MQVLCLCYNKSVEMAAKNRFPRNVTCKTAQGLAYAVYGTQYQHKQAGNLRITEVARELAPWTEAGQERSQHPQHLHGQCRHGPGRSPLCPLRRPRLTPLQERRITYVVGLAISVWKRMIDLQDAGVQITHYGYPKLCQTSRPDLSNRFGAILLNRART